MFYNAKITGFLVVEAFLILLFIVFSIYNYLRFRKVSLSEGGVSASDIAVVVIVLNTFLYLLLLKSFTWKLTLTTKVLISGLIVLWGLFNYIVLHNGQRLCDSCGMKGFKSFNLLSGDLISALALVTVWAVVYDKIIKPVVLHSPVMSFKVIEKPLTWMNFFMPVIVYCIIIPINEEILFRHGVLTSLIQLFKGTKKEMTTFVTVISIALTSVVFSMAHFQDNYFLKIVQILPIAIILALIYKRNNLWQSILIHSFFNFLNYLI